MRSLTPSYPYTGEVFRFIRRLCNNSEKDVSTYDAYDKKHSLLDTWNDILNRQSKKYDALKKLKK